MVLTELLVDVLLVVEEEVAVAAVLLVQQMVDLVELLVLVTMVMVVDLVEQEEILHTDQICVLQLGLLMVQHQVKMDL
jgi:hypothetical protein